MKKRRMIASRAEKFTRFGIRKCSLGAVSVAIATGLAFLGSGAVQADQLAPSQTADSVAVSQAVEDQASTAATPTVTETSLSSMDKAAAAPEAVSPAAGQVPTSSDTSAQSTSSDSVENARPKSDIVASTENQPAVAENSEKSDASNQPAQPASATERPLAAAEVKKPQGKITIQNNNPQTGEFDIVVSDIVAPDGLKSVSLPTWSTANDQDDVQWYTAERRADGTYFKHVSYRNHKNSLGEYNVHLYFLNEAGQLQGAGSAKTVVTRAQPQGKITIQNNNPQTGEFDIVVSDIVAPDGLKAVYLPTWSAANDQDDVQWYTAERRVDGTYFKHVSYRNHKNSLGEYNVHLYFVNDAGQLQGAGSTKTVVTRAQPQGKITIQNNNPQTGEFDIVVSDIVAPDGLKAVYLPTWSAANDQDDVQWYTAERQADGTYKKHVRAQDHKFSVGEYKVHLYYLNEDGQMQGAGGEKLMVSVAPENIRATGKINIQNNNARTGTFDVVVTNVSNPGGIQAVYLPTWSTDKDQDDIKWYLAQKQANGTYKITVRASDHKLSTGEYKIHLYYKQDNGQLIAVDATTTQVSKAVYNTPYYSQRDGRWGGRKYGPYSMDATGCVPTTLAMVISGITGTEVLPTTVADYLYNHTNEFNKDGFGTSSRGIVRAAQHWDLTTETLFTASAVKEVLSQGHHVLGAVGTSIFAHYPVTHELVLKGYDNGKTYVRDPYNAANNGWYPVDYLFGVKSVDPTDNTEGSPFIAIKG
ncbi:N-acetylmuramidase/lysin [Streptococcus sanguinis SK72]|uniref:N-acetylmuramidase/lysin n=1 Tax=Streptococcus sanguinis SK72 TaxID=888809 RepID=F0HYY8_STRSA|nr:GBS Bsp-like repeat-containing protein [Streptococcus sanguinis]EGD30591.1 N-acetylmuramidase/lysin [Streptococcus sanguinis SK72]